MASVAALFRYPVKSMLGEELDEVEFTELGLAGDRAYAVVDREDGRVASGKHPRKWSALLQLRAAYCDGAESPVTITFPDGSVVRSNDSAVDAHLSRYIGRDVTLQRHSNNDYVFEDVWPAIDGLAPPEAMEHIAEESQGRREGGDPVTDIDVAALAPPGRFFDLSALHVITTATLAELQKLAPSSNFDVRRYRPNVLIDIDETGFVENAWSGSTLAFGDEARALADMPTMRCVMTTLAHGDVPADRSSLQAVARHNRVEITGIGMWACAGIYAAITAPGTVRVGDRVDQLPSL